MKALFVGLGSIGQRHLRNLKQLCPDDLELLAVRRTKNVPLLTGNMSVSGDGDSLTLQYGLKEFSDIPAALKESPDIVFIANPSSCHVRDALCALRHGARTVFIEKPLGAAWDGIEELCELAEVTKSRLFVGYQFRFHPALRQMKSMLEEGVLGQVISARLVNGEYLPGWHPYEDYRTGYAANSELGGGALLTQIHDFDLAYWFFGRPASVYAIGGHLSSLDVDVEDSVITLLGYDLGNGCFPVSIQQDYLQYPPERSVTIVGDSGKLSWNLQENKLFVTDIKTKAIVSYGYPNFDRNSMFLEQTRHLLGMSDDAVSPMVSVNDAAVSLKMALKAKESMLIGEVLLY